MLDLISNTFLFIGFSFSDPNLDRIIAIVKRNLKEASPKKHYCFLRSINLDDYIKNTQNYDKAKEQYEQDYNAQECKIRDMRRYGIETILIDEFGQITQMLKYMQEKLKLNTVFVSGGINSLTPNDYGNFQRRIDEKIGKAEDFIMKLADTLIVKKYNIVTGFGIGVGNYIVAGAYKRSDEKRNIKIEEKIYIQPMISIEDSLEEKQNIREELLEKCGIVVTIFGKSKEDVLEDELKMDGTFIEYSIAKTTDKIIIPIGATGFTSKRIYEIEKEEWKNNVKSYTILGNSKVGNDELINNIISCIEYKKSIREENMRKILMKDLFETPEKKIIFKKVFLSFHYSSSCDVAEKVIDIIQKSDNYWVSKELEKCSEMQIQQWIDEKMKDADVTIIMFNKEFVNSRWTDYEVRRSVDRQIPFLFLINGNCNSELNSVLDTYVSQRRISQCERFWWKSEEDLEKIPSKLNSLLKRKF